MYLLFWDSQGLQQHRNQDPLPLLNASPFQFNSIKGCLTRPGGRALAAKRVTTFPWFPASSSSLTSILKRSMSALEPMRAFLMATPLSRHLPLMTEPCCPWYRLAWNCSSADATPNGTMKSFPISAACTELQINRIGCSWDVSILVGVMWMSPGHGRRSPARCEPV